MNGYSEDNKNNYPKAFWISSSIMGAMILLCFLIMVGNKLPQFGMGGIVVNYGTSEWGMGDDYMTVDEPSMDPNANQVNPDRIDPNSSPVETPSQQITDRSVATQDMEEAPTIVSKDNTKANANEATAEKKDATPKVNPNALYSGRKNNSTGRGDGTGTTAGNQGSDLGDPLASNYGEGGSGDGNMGLSIANRRWVRPPVIQDNGQQSGVVAVEVHVAPNGTVTFARAGVKGTTLPDRSLWEKCEAALRGAQLNALERAPSVQKAVIYFNFRLK